MDIRRRIGLNIKAARTNKGWSQEEMADHSRLHRTYISGLERGVRNPTVMVIMKIASALGTPPGRLFDEDID